LLSTLTTDVLARVLRAKEQKGRSRALRPFLLGRADRPPEVRRLGQQRDGQAAGNKTKVQDGDRL